MSDPDLLPDSLSSIVLSNHDNYNVLCLAALQRKPGLHRMLPGGHQGAGGGLPAPVTLGWEAGDVFSPGAEAHGQLMRLARDSVCPGRPVAQWGIVFGVSGALHGVRDIAAPLENLPGLHPALGHVSLFQGDWRLPAILQQWAAHVAIYQVSGGHSIQVYDGGGGGVTGGGGGCLRAEFCAINRPPRT